MDKQRIVRLPALKKLKSKSAHRSVAPEAPCGIVLTFLLKCWAANGEGSSGCLKLETDLKNCMKTYKPTKETVVNDAYHTQRLFPRVAGRPPD